MHLKIIIGYCVFFLLITRMNQIKQNATKFKKKKKSTHRNLLVIPTVSIQVSDVSKRTTPALLSSRPRIAQVKIVITLQPYSKEEIRSMI